MKKLIYFLIIMALASCHTRSENHIYPVEGNIIKIEKDEKGVLIEVHFVENEVHVDDYLWFVGSDTCKVGQIIKFK